MADAPRRKKLEKTAPNQAEPISTQKFYCCRCGTSYSRKKGYFPVSHSPLYRGTGYLPICGECVDEMYEQYRNILGDDMEAMRRMCMKLDLYWNEDIYKMVEKTVGVHSRIKSYIGKTNLIKYIDKTFDDTLIEEAKKEKDERSDTFSFPIQAQDAAEPLEPASQEDIDFWGSGFTVDVYAEFNKRYEGWTGGKEITDPSERALYKQICILETTIGRDAAQGKAIDKNINALNPILGSMNLKPAQKQNDADADLEKMPLGVGIQKWEYSRPLPETKKSLCDVSGTVKNITTWFLGHACKMVGLRNSYCKLYEDAMNELRVKHPEYDEEDDDTLLSDLFSGSDNGGDK